LFVLFVTNPSFFFFKKGAASGKKFTLQNVFFSSVIIEAGEACKKCSVM